MSDNSSILDNKLEQISEEDFLESNFDDFSNVEVEEVGANIYFTDSVIESCRDYLISIRDDYVRLYALNLAISASLKIENDKSLEKMDNVKLLKNRSSEKDIAVLQNCRKSVSDICLKLTKEIEEETARVNMQMVYIDGTITVGAINQLAGVITDSIGGSIYSDLVQTIRVNHNNNGSALLTLIEKQQVLHILEVIKRQCDTSDYEMESKFNVPDLYSDISLDIEEQEGKEASDNINTTSKFGIKDFIKIQEIDELNKLIDYLNKPLLEIRDNVDLPLFYTISKIVEVRDVLVDKKYNDITGSLLCTNVENSPEQRQIYKPLTFDNQFHLICINNILVRGSSLPLMDIYKDNFLPKCYSTFCGYDENKIQKLLSSDGPIINVPTFIRDRDEMGHTIIFMTEPNSTLSPEYLRQSPAYSVDRGAASSNMRDLTCEEFLGQAADKRSKVSLWYTTITPTAGTNGNLITIRDYKRSDLQTTLLTNEEMFNIAKNRNLKEILANGYAKIDEADSTLDEDSVLATDSRRVTDSAYIKEVKSVACDLIRDSHRTLKYGYSDQLSPNKDIFLNILSGHFNRPIENRLLLEDQYNMLNQNGEIQSAYYQTIFGKMEFDRDRIRDILGEQIQHGNEFFDMIKSGEYQSNPDFEISSLSIADVEDDIWVMLQVHLMGVVPQSFTGQTITYHDDMTGDRVVSKEQFIQDYIRFLSSPKSLLQLWGLGFLTGGRVERNTKAFELSLLCITEAYGLYNMLLDSETFQNFIDQGHHRKDLQEIQDKEGQDMRYTNYTYNKSFDVPQTSYEDVKDLLSESFYNLYKDYMNQVIINPLLNELMTIKSDFDSGLIINGYIHYLASLPGEKSLYYRLFANHVAMGNALPNCDELNDRLTENSPLTLKEFLNLEGVTINLSTEDESRLQSLFQACYAFRSISLKPLVALEQMLPTITSFTEEDLKTFSCRIGCDILDPEVVQFDDNFEKGEYNIKAIQSQVDEGKNLYAVRDMMLMKRIINTIKFKKLVKSFGTAKTPEDWDKLKQEMNELITSKLKIYTEDKIKSFKDGIRKKVSITLDDNKLMEVVDSYLYLISPTVIDTYIICNNINTTVTDTIATVSSDLDITTIDSDHITEEALKDLSVRIQGVSLYHNLVLALSLFLPIDIITDAISKRQACVELLSTKRTKEASGVDYTKKVKMNSALYKKYLLTGKKEYFVAADRDYVTLDLLTADNLSVFKVQGELSKFNLIMDYGLTDTKDLSAVKEMCKLSLFELLEMILDELPNLYDTLPTAVRDYVRKQRKIKLIQKI